MNNVRSRAFRIAAAYLCDSSLGDPGGYPHPVKLIGAAVDTLERRARPACRGARSEEAAGMLIGASVIGGSYLLARLALALPGAWAIETLLIYACIARKDLARSALLVADSLEEGDLEAARAGLQALAGRDSGRLDESGIARAAVESVAENLVDGVLSPLLWAAVGGAPAAVAFKASSTLDSMIGHTTPERLHIGRFSARFDDAANLPAARLSIPIVTAAASLTGLDWAGSLAIGVRDRHNHESPNSAYPEASFAGALDLGLGGPASYDGRVREHPEIGSGTRDAGPREIRNAVRLMNAASMLGLGLALLIARRLS